MAHHSSFPPNDDLRRIFGDAPEKLGATGKFPLGKLTPEDEGEIAIGFARHDGKVIVDFGKPTAWIGFTPEQADEIADKLREFAAVVRACG